MDPSMTSQFIRTGESFIASWVCTGVGFFTSVGSDVSGLGVSWFFEARFEGEREVG